MYNYNIPVFKINNLQTKFLVWDHNKDNILERNLNTLVKYGAVNYAAKIAFHWYTGNHFKNPDNSIAIILFNKYNVNIEYNLSYKGNIFMII